MMLWYELKKVWKHKRFIPVMICLLVGNGVGLFLYQSQGYDKERASLLQVYTKQSFDEANDAITQRLNELDLYRSYEDFIEGWVGETMYNPIFEDESFVKGYEEIKATLDEEITIYQKLYDYYHSVENYPDYLNNIKDNVNSFIHSPAWSSYSASTQETYKTLFERYESLTDIYIYPMNYIPAQTSGVGNPTIWVCIFAMMIITYHVYAVDDDMDSLFFTMARGRTRLQLSKLWTMIIYIFFFVVIVGVLNILLSQVMNGLIDWSAPIQSVSNLYTLPWKQTIWQWTVLNYGIFFVGLSVLALIYSLILRFTKNKPVFTAIFFCLLGTSALLYLFISDTSIMVLLKYLNLFALVNPEIITSTYHIISFSDSIIVSRNLVIGLVMGVGVLTFLLSVLLSSRKTKKQTSHQIFKLARMNRSLTTHTSLFFHEVYKLLVHKKAWIVIYLFGVILVMAYNNMKLSPDETINNKLLAEYYQRYGGEMNADKKDILEQLYTHYSNQFDNLMHVSYLYRQQSIQEETYNEGVLEYTEEAESRNLISKIYEHFLVNPEMDYLVYPNGFQALFSMNTHSRDFWSSSLIIIVCVLVFTPIYIQDQRKHEDDIYRLTIRGRSNLRNKKLMLVLGGTSTILVLVMSVEFMGFIYNYPMDNWGATLGSIIPQGFSTQEAWLLDLTLWQYYSLLFATRLIGVWFLAMTIMYVSKNMNSVIHGILVMFGLCFIPMVLFQFGLEPFKYISIVDIIMGNMFYYHTFSIVKVLIFLFMMILLTIRFVHQTKD